MLTSYKNNRQTVSIETIELPSYQTPSQLQCFPIAQLEQQLQSNCLGPSNENDDVSIILHVVTFSTSWFISGALTDGMPFGNSLTNVKTSSLP